MFAFLIFSITLENIIMSMLSFSKIRSVAIIGVSEDPKKIGHILFAHNQRFWGNIYGINPKGGKVLGKTLYKSISDLPEVPDIAVFAIPEPFIYDSLTEAGKFGIKKVIIITAGFKEIGNVEWEKKLKKIAKKYNIHLLWPNCLGFADTWNWLNLSFGSELSKKWNIGIISQSGAMAVGITDVITERGLGFSSLYTLGNKADLDETDILRELLHDEHTDVIAIYLESITRGKEFIQILSETTTIKPVIVMIGGISSRGRSVTASHTGSLSGDGLVYEAAIGQGGGILTYSLREYFELIDAFSRSYGEVLVHSPIIITNAGGPWVLATDQCEFHNIPLSDITPYEADILRTWMPATMSTKNPIDIIWDADSSRVSLILNNIAKIRDNADILFIFTIQATTDIENIARQIINFKSIFPLYTLYIAIIAGESGNMARHILRNAWVYVTDTTESLISTYATISNTNREKNEKKASEFKKHISTTLLSQNNTELILSHYNIKTSHSRECSNWREVEKYIQTMPWPYVSKISWSNIAHKTESWWVIVNLETTEQVYAAYKHLRSVAPQSDSCIAISRYIVPSPRIEFFFGAKRDEQFGDIFIIWMGWIYIHIFLDTKIHIGKWKKWEIQDTLNSLRMAPIFHWYRHQTRINMKKLESMICKLSRLFEENQHIKTIDINPILFENGEPIIVDAKLYI